MLQTIFARLERLAREELRNEVGATAVEYGIMVALIAAVIVGVVAALGLEVQAAFQAVVDALPF
jgi:pilus assembly protein Flp/PilA